VLPKELVRDLYVLNRRSGPGQAFASATSQPLMGPDLLYWRMVRGAR
jgi:hypothetical protein